MDGDSKVVYKRNSMYLGKETKTHQQIMAELSARRIADSCIKITEMTDQECEEFDRINDDLKARNIFK